jgi:hypothetical protein
LQNYKSEAYQKVFGLAKISDDLSKRELEDATVKIMNKKGINAIPTDSNILDNNLARDENFKQKTDTLRVDVLLVYTITGNNTQYQNTPSVKHNKMNINELSNFL